jgi:hypothetical protein
MFDEEKETLEDTGIYGKPTTSQYHFLKKEDEMI